MRPPLLVIAVLAGLAVLGLAALLFFSMGGFQWIAARRAVSERGFAATEPVTAPGFRQLKLPKGWVRDDYPEQIEDGVAQRPRAPGPRPNLVMFADDHARIHFSLGSFSSTAGTQRAALLTGSLRPFEAGPWPDVKEEKSGGVELYDAARRVRWTLRTTPDVYSVDQARELVRSVAASAEVDEAALAAAYRERAGQAAGKRGAVQESKVWIARHFGVPEPLADGLHAVKERSFLWVDEETVQAYVFVGEVAANGKPPRETAKGLKAKVRELYALSSTGPAEIVLYSLEQGAEIGEHRTDTPLPAAVQRALPKDAVAVYRYASLYLPDRGEVERWFTESAALAKRAAAGQPAWRE